MIKKFASKMPEDELYKKIMHLICSLYKIKTINRKVVYDDKELKTLVLSSPIGQQVISELLELKVTQNMLIDYELLFFYRILGDCFPEF